MAGIAAIGSMAVAAGPSQDFSIPFPKGRSSPFTVQTDLRDPRDSTASHISVTWGPCTVDPMGNPLGQISIAGVANGRTIVSTKQAGTLRAQAIVPWFDLATVTVFFVATLDDGTVAVIQLSVNFYPGGGQPGSLSDAGIVTDETGLRRPLFAASENTQK